MTLKTNTLAKTKTADAAPKEQETIKLELALHDRYTRQGQLYVKANEQTGKKVVYAFKPDQAEILLQEVDNISGLPLWRRYRPQITAEAKRVQMTEDRMVVDVTDDLVETAVTERRAPRLDVGSDEELAELGILELPPVSGDVVTIG